MGIMETKMETTRGCIGGYIGIVEKKMEIAVMGYSAYGCNWSY